MSERPLDGQIAVITGAGRGIGAAIAIAFADAGATVYCAARTESEVRATCDGICSNGGHAVPFVADVTDAASVQRLMDTAAGDQARIDILVISAGRSTGRETVEESEIVQWRAVLETNLFGAYYCARSAIPHLRKSPAGKIITIGSGLGHKGAAASSAYSVSKAGLWMLTRVLAQELVADGISVNELIPGPVNTSMSRGSGTPPKDSLWATEWYKEPSDVIPLAMFLATQRVGPAAQSFSLMRRDT